MKRLESRGYKLVSKHLHFNDTDGTYYTTNPNRLQDDIDSAIAAQNASQAAEIKRLREALNWFDFDHDSTCQGRNSYDWATCNCGALISQKKQQEALSTPTPPGLGEKLVELGRMVADPKNWVLDDPTDGRMGGQDLSYWQFRPERQLREISQSEELKTLRSSP